MKSEHLFLGSFLIYKVILIFLIYLILLTTIDFYTRLDDNTLLNSHPFICILLHTEFILMILFPILPRNINLSFPIKSTVTAKETKLNRKQIGISLRFALTKYKVQEAMFKFATIMTSKSRKSITFRAYLTGRYK